MPGQIPSKSHPFNSFNSRLGVPLVLTLFRPNPSTSHHLALHISQPIACVFRCSSFLLRLRASLSLSSRTLRRGADRWVSGPPQAQSLNILLSLVARRPSDDDGAAKRGRSGRSERSEHDHSGGRRVDRRTGEGRIGDLFHSSNFYHLLSLGSWTIGL